MLRMVLHRIGAGLVTLWVVSVLIFIGTEILPGDAAEMRLGQEITRETLAALREELGLDRPAPIRYLEWLRGLATFDLGMSLAGGTSIEDLISGRLYNTLLLTLLTALVSVPLAVSLGLLAAMFPGSLLDRVLTTGTLSLISVPEFLIASILVYVLAVQLRWFPAVAYISENQSVWNLLNSLVLPIVTLSIAVSAQMIRMTRAAVLNVMSAPYIEMAILKGVPRGRIVLRHALFNAIGPVVNVIALNLAYLVSGVVIVETVFAYPGLAKLMVDSVQVRDLPMVQACAIIFCATYILLILVADIASVLSNPRIRHPK